MSKIHIETIHEYELILKKALSDKGYSEEKKKKLKGAYMEIFNHGVKFANKKLRLDTDNPIKEEL